MRTQYAMGDLGVLQMDRSGFCDFCWVSSGGRDRDRQTGWWQANRQTDRQRQTGRLIYRGMETGKYRQTGRQTHGNRDRERERERDR